ncbi:MAG: phosphate acyltransferase PlsX [Lachnospiraceae bacterium]|nr:phosphate acyltransferase PlsX [Lachnospiraceae bacterium]
MSEIIRVALDGMGGDLAPVEMVRGAVKAVQEMDNVKITILGDEKAINEELNNAEGYDKERIVVYPTTEVIEMAEPPVNAIRSKKDTSIVKGMQLVRNGECDAFVSGGSTGAILVGGQVIVGRIKGVERPPLAPLFPTVKGMSLLVDCGANVDSKPSQLVQYAKMGTIYMREFVGIENPTVGIVNIGAEEEKGNALVKEAFPLLKECKDINFVGSVEARDIPFGAVDIMVCDAFVGNVILKLYEGTAQALIQVIKKGMMSSLRGKIGGALVKPSLKKTIVAYTAADQGGAPLLGLKGLVVKMHGNSTAVECASAIRQCVKFYEAGINEKFKESFCKAEEEKKPEDETAEQ